MVVEAGSMSIMGSINVDNVKAGLMDMKREMEKASGEAGKLFGGINRLGREAAGAGRSFVSLGAGAAGILIGLTAAFGPGTQVQLERFGILGEQAGIAFDKVLAPALGTVADTLQGLLPIINDTLSAYEGLRDSVSQGLGGPGGGAGGGAGGFEPLGNLMLALGIGGGARLIPGVGSKIGLRGIPAAFGALTALEGGFPGPAQTPLQGAQQIGGGALIGGALGGIPGAALGGTIAALPTIFELSRQFTESLGLGEVGRIHGTLDARRGFPSTSGFIESLVIHANNVIMEGGTAPI